MIVAINLETGKSTNVSWNIYSAPFDAETVYDLISGRRISLVRASGGRRSLMLSGGQMFCLCKDRKELERVIELEARDRFLPEKIERQEAAAMAFRAIAAKTIRSFPAAKIPCLRRKASCVRPEQFLRDLYGRRSGSAVHLLAVARRCQTRSHASAGAFSAGESPLPVPGMFCD